jgi:tetratricopeptide (TPR) repeat protein
MVSIRDSFSNRWGLAIARRSFVPPARPRANLLTRRRRPDTRRAFAGADRVRRRTGRRAPARVREQTSSVPTQRCRHRDRLRRRHPPGTKAPVTASALEAARRAYARHAWREAYRTLSDAAVEPADLERRAVAAYMVGKETEYVNALERAHRGYVDAGRMRPACRCAFWVGVSLARRGDRGPASGWFSRARRLAAVDGGDCVERGYLLLPVVFEQEARGEWDHAAATAGAARAFGERFDDADLCALAGHEQGHIHVRQGRFADGLPLLDEAMVAASAGELSPIVTGIVYCGVILACQEAHDVRRAQEWTAMLSRWCDEQTEMVAFTGRCRIHRAELLQLRGDWTAALAEARRAAAHSLRGENLAAAGEAHYRQGEIHRLRGDFGAAEHAYAEASAAGREPQPGLALLRLAQGETDSAAAAIARLVAETDAPAARAAVLPASVEVSLARGDLAEAGAAGAELDRLARAFGTSALAATAAFANGATRLADGDPIAALRTLRTA